MRIFVNEFCGHAFQLELSRELSRRGHIVYHTFFADNVSTPKGVCSGARDVPNLAIEGVHIRSKFSKHALFSRRAADIEYGKRVASAVRSFRPDIVISANMPLDAQKILLDTSHRVNAKFVFWLQDIYSMAVRFVLKEKASFLSAVVSWHYENLEKKLLRRSDAIICIAPAFAERLVDWGIDASKTAVIPNWAPLHEVVPTPKNNAWARGNGVADRFCFLYSGTLGMKHRPELLLELAKDLQGSGDARLIVIAGGAGADWLRQRAHEVGSGVLTLLPFQPYEQISQALGSADVLITLLNSEAGAFAVPSKTMSYLCAGRPQIVAAPEANEVAKVVARANAGIIVSPDAPQEFIHAARSLLSNHGLCAEFGRNARKYAEQHFAIAAIADRFLEIFAAGIPSAGKLAPKLSRVPSSVTSPDA
jgi:colanic acid biosynthesis glycosyl transferase WcaI